MKFFSCVCKNEVLAVDVDREFSQIYLAMYKMKHTYTLLSRLKMIWHVIRYGHPYTDEIILDKKTAKELIKTLKEYIKEIK